MRQLERLRHAKESAIASSLTAAQYEDRVGVTSFSNLAQYAPSAWQKQTFVESSMIRKGEQYGN